MFFILFSKVAIFFGLGLVFFQNPMYSILSLVGCILFSVMILFMYGFEFMSFVYLVVYIGAIAILFLFMIMMLNVNCINLVSSSASSRIDFFLYLCIFFKSLYFLFLVNKDIYRTFLNENILNYDSNNLVTKLFSGLDATSELASFCLLYNIYILYLVLAGFILLFAMLGSISLCISK